MLQFDLLKTDPSSHARRGKLTLNHGSLTLGEIHLPWITKQASIELNGKAVETSLDGGSARFKEPITLRAGDALVIVR